MTTPYKIIILINSKNFAICHNFLRKWRENSFYTFPSISFDLEQHFSFPVIFRGKKKERAIDFSKYTSQSIFASDRVYDP